MGDWSPLEDDVFLKGMLTVVILNRNGHPCGGLRVVVRGCGFI
ncbi:MAG TPA: hypothetical protein VG122_08055 [Gemmata sp.]|jgi:hypothetical protein|nr:hypothetical protein [Gemmata sp.]